MMLFAGEIDATDDHRSRGDAVFSQMIADGVGAES